MVVLAVHWYWLGRKPVPQFFWFYVHPDRVPYQSCTDCSGGAKNTEGRYFLVFVFRFCVTSDVCMSGHDVIYHARLNKKGDLNIKNAAKILD